MFILPVHYGTKADYDALRDRKRREWPDPEALVTIRDFNSEYPPWFYNDIAGFVEIRVEGVKLEYTIFAARGGTPPGRWRRDRRMRRRYSGYERGRVSLRWCKRRPDYVREANRCLDIARKLIPKNLACEWDPWRELFRSVDWRRLVLGSTESNRQKV